MMLFKIVELQSMHRHETLTLYVWKKHAQMPFATNMQCCAALPVTFGLSNISLMLIWYV
jgi:hypothetical protein